MGKNGPEFHASKDEGDGKEHIDIRPMAVSGISATGLSGKFDLSLKYVRDDAPAAKPD